MKEQLNNLFVTIMQVVLPVLAVGIGLLGKKLHDWIAAKVKNEKLSGILERLNDAAMTVVQEVEQTVVSKLDPTKPLGENAAVAKAAALASLKTHLGQKGIDEIKTVLGIGDGPLEALLVSYIESKVSSTNRAILKLHQTRQEAPHA